MSVRACVCMDVGVGIFPYKEYLVCRFEIVRTIHHRKMYKVMVYVV